MRYSGWAITGLILASLSGARGQSSAQAFGVIPAQIEGPEWTAKAGADGPSTTFRNQSGKLILSARGQSTTNLTLLPGQRPERAVIDNTGLTGEYNLQLEWAADEAADSSLPSIFTALQEHLGLRLESTNK